MLKIKEEILLNFFEIFFVLFCFVLFCLLGVLENYYYTFNDCFQKSGMLEWLQKNMISRSGTLVITLITTSLCKIVVGKDPVLNSIDLFP